MKLYPIAPDRITLPGTIYISGSRDMERLSPQHQLLLEKLVNVHTYIVVSDQPGTDTVVQQALASLRAKRVEVYYYDDYPALNLGNWPTVPVRTKTVLEAPTFDKIVEALMTLSARGAVILGDERNAKTLAKAKRINIRCAHPPIICNENGGCYYAIDDAPPSQLQALGVSEEICA